MHTQSFRNAISDLTLCCNREGGSVGMKLYHGSIEDMIEMDLPQSKPDHDLGDDWIHDITLEKVLNQPSTHASCTAGKGAYPEEDSGGVWDYEEMKESGEIDAAYFDIDEVKEGVENLSPTGYKP